MRIRSIDHVQLAMPAGGETLAREFYQGLLGIPEKAKPANLSGRGGCWFESGPLKIHLGVEADFQRARKAHPGLLVDGLPDLIAVLQQAGCTMNEDQKLPGYVRVYVDDPFGNRIELMEPETVPALGTHDASE